MRMNNKKTFLIIALVASFVFMGIGYSLLSKTLEITSINRSAGNWDVHFGTITPSVTGNAVSRSVIKSSDSLQASFIVDLFDAGDEVEYTIVVENDGNIPAKLSDVQTSTTNLSSFISMTNNAVINTVIQPNSTYSFKVNIAVDSSSGLPLEDVVGSKYTVTLDFVQNT